MPLDGAFEHAVIVGIGRDGVDGLRRPVQFRAFAQAVADTVGHPRKHVIAIFLRTDHHVVALQRLMSNSVASEMRKPVCTISSIKPLTSSPVHAPGP